MIKIINFDMDGVLVDLSKNLARLDGFEDAVNWYIQKYEEDGNLLYIKAIENHLDDECFLTCDPMPCMTEMKKLMRYLLAKGYKINILSSCMDKPYSNKIANQKVKWLEKYYGDLINNFNQINIVNGSKVKIDYIGEESLLIDDYPKTQKQFIENGKGDQFILYKNFEDCLSKLNELNII